LLLIFYYIFNIYSQAKLQQEVLNDHDGKHQAEMQLLRSQLLEVSEEKEQEISVRKIMETELRNRATELTKRVATLEAELCAKKEENKIQVCYLLPVFTYFKNTTPKVTSSFFG